MKLEQSIVDMIREAEAKALATCSNSSVNVVPVSTVKVTDDTIWLMNYFMGETLLNIQNNPEVALACWKGLKGVKIKAKTELYTEGDLFEEAKAFVMEVAPTRILKSLLILTPTAIYDSTPEAELAGVRIF